MSWNFSYSQEGITGSVNGRVVDEITKLGIEGVNIEITALKKVITTDSEGKFEIKGIPVGRHDIVFSFVGYATKKRQIFLKSSKTQYLKVDMAEIPTLLDEVNVSSESYMSLPNVASGKSFTIEETNRIPANFFDPVRVATAFPGVVASHDQANNLVIRGNSPNTLLWRLEGINIVNPNHLSNAGTFADKPLQTGGGVNILSGQMLGETQFLNGPMPVEYGNGFSAFDLSFRPGNKKKHEFTGQLSVIGADLSSEGPIGNKGASYLINYRYSFVGILTGVFGLDFGGESITFQDLAFNVDSPIGDNTHLKVFGFAGLSSNYFRTNEDPDSWEVDKDSKNILYDEQVTMLGASLETSLNTGSLKLTSGISESNQDRNEEDFNSNIDLIYQGRNRKNDLIFSNNLVYESKFKSGTYRIGTFIDYKEQYLSDWFINNTINYQNDFYGEFKGLEIRPYADISYQFNANFGLNAGTAYYKHESGIAGTLEPRITFFYDLNQGETLSLGYGRTGTRIAVYSQSAVPQAINDQYNLRYSNNIKKDWQLTGEMYYQKISGLPTSTDGTVNYFNMLDYILIEDFIQQGEGRNYGVELFVNKNLSNKYYLIAGGSLYESEYLLDGQWEDSQFNGNYTATATWGREVTKQNRTFGINARMTYLGGFRRAEINESLSRAFNTTVFDFENGFNIQNGDYFRMDFSVNWKKSKKKYTRTIGVDIQNVLNMENDGFYYFDIRSDQVLTRPQLGMVPVILYRIDF